MSQLGNNSEGSTTGDSDQSLDTGRSTETIGSNGSNISKKQQDIEKKDTLMRLQKR